MSASPSIRDRLQSSYKEAMKAREQVSIATLRLVMAALKDRDIAAREEGNGDGINDAATLNMLQSMIKQREDSIALYEQAGRDDLVVQEKSEITIIEGFLPKQMDGNEVMEAVQETINAIDAKSIKDMGKVVARLKEEYAGRMNFPEASVIIKDILCR